MPSKMHYVGGGVGVVYVASGVITTKDMVAMADKQYRRPSVLALRKFVLLDFRDVDKFIFDTDDIAGFVDTLNRTDIGEQIADHVILGVVETHDKISFGALESYYKYIRANTVTNPRTVMGYHNAMRILQSELKTKFDMKIPEDLHRYFTIREN